MIQSVVERTFENVAITAGAREFNHFLLATQPKAGLVLTVSSSTNDVAPSLPWNVVRRWRRIAGMLIALFVSAGQGSAAPDHSEIGNAPADFAILTNRAQLAQLPKSVERMQWIADVEGTVLAAGNELAVVSFEGVGQTKIIDARGSEQPLKRGQRIRYRGNWLVGDDDDLPGGWATVNNDGTHSMVSASGRATLTAGRHAIRLVYFNAGGLAGLEVYYEGPGCPRQQIPAAALSHQVVDEHGTNLAPGLTCRYLDGLWPSAASLADTFTLRKPAPSGVMSDFNLDPATETNRFGLELSGFVEIPQTGLYEFTTVSDDGSLLFVATEPPKISVLSAAEPLPLVQSVAGEVWNSTNEATGGTLDGRASFVHPGEPGLNFEMRGDNGRTFARLLKPGLLTPELLNGSRIRATGLARRALSPEGVEILGQLLIPSDAAVDILNLPNRVWSTFLVKTIPEFKVMSRNSSASLCRIAGRLRQKQPDGNWEFGNEQEVLSVELRGSPAIPGNDPVELLLSSTRNAEGAWIAPTWRRLAPARDAGKGLLPVLTSIEEVKKLTRAEAQRGYPVSAHGVVTFLWPGNGFFLQDDSWSIDVRTTNLVYDPHIGEFWAIEGFTFAEFAPNIQATAARQLGSGVLPAPEHPTLPQLMDGSLDTKYVEVQGVVSSVDGDRVMLLMREGRIRIQLPNLPQEILNRSLNAFVRIRGCVVPGRELGTQKVLIGEVGLMNAQLTIDRPAPQDVFDLPTKTVPELLLFDAQATSLQRAKIHGQILHQRDQEFFLIDISNGARFVPKTPLRLAPGDMVEVVGFPDLKGPTPLLRDAAVRVNNNLPLPPPVELSPDELVSNRYDSTLVQVQANLLSQRQNKIEQILELQIGARTFLARLSNDAGALPDLRPGSRLNLRGVYVGMGGDRVAGREIDSFEILLNTPDDVRVTRLPSWWTARHALVALAVLGTVLLLAMAWIAALRRRVARRTRALRVEIQEHERTEHQLELKTQMLEKEIEERKRMELEIEKGHKQLLATSRLAGMAEVATSVLHNVGNVMTSVNILSSAIVKQVHESKAPSVARLGDLLRQKQEELGKFVAEDQRGQLLPTYVSDLGGHLAQEQSLLLEKVSALKENIHHINEIVALQQDYATVTGMLENIAPVELVENALRMQGESMKRHHIALIREFQTVPPVTIDRHKTLQILFNLLENAKHACLQTTHERHEVKVTLQPCEGNRFELAVIDNGMGISAENLPRIFDQGFSTRRDGHGLGLHSSILMAQDMGGTLTVQSRGSGQGARFTLRLPLQAPKPATHVPGGISKTS